MSKRVWLWVCGVLVVLAFFATGPRVNLEYQLKTPQLPADLDDYLRGSEAGVPDLVPDTEKRIVWADDRQKTRTPLALVYIHGFSATRQEISPVCERLAARLGANLFLTRLTGHGRTGAAMAEATIEDWLQDGIEALAMGQRLGERVVLIGTSTGATLISWLLANGHQNSVAGAVMISPNFGPRDPLSELLLWPWGAQMARMVEGPVWRWQPINERHERFWTTEFPVEALPTMMGLVKLARESDLGKVRVPLLALFNSGDRIVNSDAIKTYFDRFGSQRKQLVEIKTTGDPQRHVLAGDVLSPGTTDEIVDRIAEFSTRTIQIRP